MADQLPHIQQALAERANALAYGDTARVAELDRRLALLGAAAKREAAAVVERREESSLPPMPPKRVMRPREIAGGEA